MTGPVRQALRPAILESIRNPSTALSVWKRAAASPLQAELDALKLEALDDVVLTADLDDLNAALTDAMAEAGYDAADHLRKDIVSLSRRHAKIEGHAAVSLRLEIVEDNACRRFHADYVRARTITTYVGQGTQWIDAARKIGDTPPDNDAIHRIETGAVAVFKGQLWLENPVVLHRSPPIAGSGERRLVLVIDPPPAEDAWTAAMMEEC